MRNKINSYWAKYDGSVWLIGQALWHRAIASDFIRQVTATFATRIFLIGLSLLTSVIIARVLGPKGRGIYAVAITIGAIGVQFCNLGLHTSNTYYVAKDRKLLPAIAGNSLLISFGLGGLGAAIAGSIFYLQPSFAPLHGLILLLALVSIPIGLAYMLLQNLLLGIYEIRAYNNIQLSSKTLGLLLLVLVIYFKSVTVEIIVLSNLATMVIGLLWILGRLKTYFTEPTRPSGNLLKEHIGYGIKAYLACFFAFIVLRVDLLMIQYMLGEKQSGYYSVAVNLADLIYMFPVVVGTIILPKLSSITSHTEKWKFTKKTIAFLSFFLLIIAVIAALIAQPVVLFMFGRDFIPAALAFVGLIPGVFFLGIQNVASQFLNSVGCPMILVFAWFASSILNIILNIYFIAKYGILGASIASSISYVIIFLLVGSIIYQEVRFYNQKP